MQSLNSLLVVAGVLASMLPARAQSAFVNWENPHVHPLELSPARARLFAVNTPDNRLEVFDATAERLPHLFDVPVGLDPVSVRARSENEVWVVNHISDSVSIVDLTLRCVVATLDTDDEPTDVVFAGNPQRAFVSCSQANTVLVFDPANLAAAPVRIPIAGDEPRAMAVDANGSKVFVAIFESGNRSTVLGGGATGVIGFPPNVVNSPLGPWGGQNPPPNSGTAFDPPINAALPAPPKVGLIVKRSPQGQWEDDNGGDWTALVSGANAVASGRPVGWDLFDNDVAIVDTASLSVSYARGLLNICMALAVNPQSGELCVVGTDATNEVRFEPRVRGTFVRARMARVDPAGPPGTPGPTVAGITDLNPHLGYTSATVAQTLRDRSLGDPRGLVWNSAGTRAYVSGMGSNNVIVLDALGNRAGLAPTIEVGEGPTGVVLDETRERLYVLDKFESAISVVDTSTETEFMRVGFHDPSPQSIKRGRKHLYDTHRTSGLGQVACASCHVDGRIDHLAWDLGDPTGAMAPVAGQNLGANLPVLNTGFQDFHPMKGPMTTQTLQDIIGKEPLHWRGDRNGLEDFNAAFVNLQGDDVQLTATEMQEFEDFLATITLPPNPFRNPDNSLPTSLPLPGHHAIGNHTLAAGQPLPNGNAVTGLNDFRTKLLDAGAIRCVTCHTLPTGMGTDFKLVGTTFQPIAPGPNGERHHALISQDGSTNVSIKVPQLRTLYEKVGFEMTQQLNRSGFGFLHDGSVDSLARFVSEPVFTLNTDQQVANMIAFMLSFSGSDLPQGSLTGGIEPPGTASKDTHAAVGTQTTLLSMQGATFDQLLLIDDMLFYADSNEVGLVVKGRQGNVSRGYAFTDNASFQSDRSAEVISAQALAASASPANPLTYTLVPLGSQVRIGIDRDQDGVFDRDELDAGSDPTNAASYPGASVGTTFCVGHGTLAQACPCGNSGDAGHGCGNSVHAGGAVLEAHGLVYIDPQSGDDSIVLGVHDVPPASNVVYLQGDALLAGGELFGDGVRCVDGNLVRIAQQVSDANGSASYPQAGDASLAERGGIAGGTTRYYQAYYRNVDASWCTPATFNVTQGIALEW